MALRLALRHMRNPAILSCNRLKPAVKHRLITVASSLCTEKNGLSDKPPVIDNIVTHNEMKSLNDVPLVESDKNNIISDVATDMNVESIMMMNHAEEDFDVGEIDQSINDRYMYTNSTPSMESEEKNITNDVAADMNFESIMMMNHVAEDFVVDDTGPDSIVQAALHNLEESMDTVKSGIDNLEEAVVQTGYQIDDMLLENVDNGDHEDLNVAGSDETEMNIESVMINSTNETSEEYEDDEDYEYSDDDIRAQILSVALENVSMYGWTDKNIEKAVEMLELSPSSSNLFKRGAVDLVLYFIEEGNNVLIDHLARESKKANLSSEDARSAFIEQAIKTRLEMIVPYIDSWPEALKLMASPTASREVFENGAHLLDEILYHAGDFSTDISWYAKRGVLTSINIATELHLLNDKSPDHQATWAFLHRRMQDARVLHYAKDSVTNVAGDAFNLATAGVTLAQNILGINKKR